MTTHRCDLLPGGRVISRALVEFVTQLADFAILTTIALLWAKWSKLDMGLSKPAFSRAEPWVLLFILWTAAEWAITIYLPVEVDPDWLARMDQLSLGESLIILVLLAPMCEELLFRGAMFAALLRRWGIWPAALIPSVVWGLIHAQYEWWFMASIAGSGVVLAMVRWRSGSIYLCVGLHAAWNLLATLDSHGLFGPVA
jgi:membrane protease YdiL (CAAX protease family)